MAKSVNSHGIGLIKSSNTWFSQVPLMCGFHKELTGKQMNAPPKKVATHHATTMAPRIHRVIRKVRVTKIRYSNMRIEILDRASEVHCRRELA